MDMGRSFKINFKEDAAIFQNLWVRIWFMIFMGLMAASGLFLGRFELSILNQMGIAVIGAIGLNLLIGYTGQISLGHGAFLAIGGYTSALLTGKLGFPFPLSLLASGCMAAGLGMIVGIPSLRLKGLYLALGTLAFSFIVEYVLFHWDLTQGDLGMPVQPIDLLGLVIKTEREFFFLILVIASLATLCAKNLVRSKIGRSFIAIRDRDVAAEAMGIPLAQYKVMAFGISSFYGGIAGCLTAHYNQWIVPGSFDISVSIAYIAMTIVGGLGSILGSILGAILITGVPYGIVYTTDLLKHGYPAVSMMIVDVKLAIFGFIIVATLLVEPRGLFGVYRRAKIYFKTWPFKY